MPVRLICIYRFIENTSTFIKLQKTFNQFTERYLTIVWKSEKQLVQHLNIYGTLQIAVFASNDSNFGICVIGVCVCLKDVSCQWDYFCSMPLLGQLTGIQNIFWCLGPVYVYHSHLSICVCVSTNRPEGASTLCLSLTSPNTTSDVSALSSMSRVYSHVCSLIFLSRVT